MSVLIMSAMFAARIRIASEMMSGSWSRGKLPTRLSRELSSVLFAHTHDTVPVADLRQKHSSTGTGALVVAREWEVEFPLEIIVGKR